MKNNKYFIAQVEERNGEYEYSTTILIVQTTKRKAEKVHTKICKYWYGEKDNDKYYFNCYEVSVCEGMLEEITETTYNEISKFLNTLN